jgi:hypothetical protein
MYDMLDDESLTLVMKQTNGCSGVAPWFGGAPASGCDTRRAIVGA